MAGVKANYNSIADQLHTKILSIMPFLIIIKSIKYM